LNKAGVLILVSKCRTGIGPATFYNLMAGCSSPGEVMTKIEKEYELGYHKAAKLAEISSWAEIWAVTDLAPELMKKIFIRPFPVLQSALDSAFAAKGPDARVLFLMDGSITVPNIPH